MITINLSQSALGNSHCILKFKRTVIDGYSSLPSANIVYGEAVHKFIDTMFKTKANIKQAREDAIKVFNQPKNENRKSAHLSDEKHMLSVAQDTWFMYIIDDKEFEVLSIDDTPLTEQSFSIEYYKDEYVTVNLQGTLDTLGKIKGGCYAYRDWKTTTSWDNAGYFKQFELSRQFRFYIMALKLIGKMYPDSAIGKIGLTKLGAFIDGIFVKPEVNKTVWKRSVVHQFDDEDIFKFQRTVDDSIQRISSAIKNNYFPKEGITNGTCDGKYGMCNYYDVCANSDAVGKILLDRDFKKKNYNPLNYSGL